MPIEPCTSSTLHTKHTHADMLARVGASLRKAASLFNGMPDELPAVRSIARFDGAPGGAYAATVHTDREWGGRSRATELAAR